MGQISGCNTKLGDIASFGEDPRRIAYAGADIDGISINFKDKYVTSQKIIKQRYDSLRVPYNGLDNDDYAGGTSFCNSCRVGSAKTGTLSGAEGKRLGANENAELLQYYYHPDHLGSSSFITDIDGNVAQHVEYVPFGEVFLEEHNNTWQTPYLFNGKELDEDTGLYYYGARYYEPKVSLFISHDPLAEQTGTPYQYCYQNPINLIDPTGMEGEDPPTQTHLVKRGENLTSISKQYGVSVNDLVAINPTIKDSNKIRENTNINVLPEASFSHNPQGDYQNPNFDSGEVVNYDYLECVGIDFVLGGPGEYGARLENDIVVGTALESVKDWDVVQGLVINGVKALANKKPGEIYKAKYRPGTLAQYTGNYVKEEFITAFYNFINGTNYFEHNEEYYNPVHVLGTFNFTMRVNGDGKSATVAVYDSKTFTSFSDGTININFRTGRSFTNTYQRYIWTVPLK